MPRALATADALLKELGRAQPLFDRARGRSLVWFGIACGACYGSCMGSFSATSLSRLPLMLFVALKLPMLIAVTTALCFPGFFVLNTVLGLRAQLGAAVQAILIAQASLLAALCAMAPLILFVYASQVDHDAALIANCVLFAVATGVGHVSMWRGYRPLCADPLLGARHRWMLRVWVGLYAFVGMQTGWMLRPFVGNPGMPVGFFRSEPFSNAYLEIAALFLRQ